jgi:hypothetical protein
MPTVLTIGLRNRSTQVAHVLLSTSRMITVPPSTIEEDMTIVEFNQTEADAWAKAIETPIVAAWIAEAKLTIKQVPNPSHEGRSLCGH